MRIGNPMSMEVEIIRVVMRQWEIERTGMRKGHKYGPELLGLRDRYALARAALRISVWAGAPAGARPRQRPAQKKRKGGVAKRV